MSFHDHATGGSITVDFEFIAEAARIDGDNAPADSTAREGMGRRFPNVTVPTLIVHGLRDDTVDPNLSRTFARARPSVKLVEVDDDHQLVASIPRICREVDAFLAARS
ncbi:MAG: hypothetical protein NVS3B20_15590 [Polyangiales bacterium]